LNQPYLPTIEEYFYQTDTELVVGQFTSEHEEILKYGFMYDPTTSAAISSVVEACAIMYTKSIEPFEEFIRNLIRNSELGEYEISQLLGYTVDKSETSGPYIQTATVVSAVHDDRLKALREWKKHFNYQEYIGGVAEEDYYKANSLLQTFEQTQIPFSQFVHAFIFTQDDIAALNSFPIDEDSLKQLDLLEIQQEIVALRTGDDAFHNLHADKLVSMLVARFYKNFMLYYGNDYSQKELEFEN
jgi:hypothetical protein